MPITALPTPPLRTDPTNFAARGDALMAALPAFVTQANDTAAAMNLNSTTDASTSSVLIGTGAKTFTVTSSKSFQPGMWLVIASTAAPSTNAMNGTITSYSGTALVMNIVSVLGSGTFAAWTISQSAPGGTAAMVGLGNVDNTSDVNKPVSTAQANALALKASPGDIQAQTATAVTTVGSSTAYVIATLPVQPSLVAGQRYRIKLHTPNGAAPTLVRDGLAAVALRVYNSAGAKVAPAAGALPTLFDVEYDGVDYVVLTPLPGAAAGANTDITSLGNNTSTVYATAGTATAYTITPNPAITTYTAGQSFQVNLHLASGVAPTLQINGVALPPNIVRRLQNGAFQNVSALPAGMYRITLLSATQALVESVVPLIVGTVSQAAGVPTGAVIERGSNANGEYVRFADGTQICTNAGVLGTTAGLDVSLTTPAAFIAAPHVTVSVRPGTANDTVCGFSDSATVVVFRASNTNAANTVKLVSVGRWF